MKTLNASEYGIIPGEQVAEKLDALLKSLRGDEEEKTVVFAPGKYYVDSDFCPEEKLYITNTIANREYKRGEKKHIQKIAFNIQDTHKLTLAGMGATFVMQGRVTNAVIRNCSDITFEGIEITAENPDEHEFTVENIGKTFVDFRLDSESTYIKKKNGFYFTGKDYCSPFLGDLITGWYFGKISGTDRNRIIRSRHPFSGLLCITEKEKNLFRVKYASADRFEKGETYCIYDVRRTNVGFFMENSKNITLREVKQRHNVSLAVVAQNTENISIEGVSFCPAEGSVKQFVSYADFLQFCMCKGQINVTDSVFRGAGDDVLNVHGTHLKIVSAKQNEITLKYMHSESYGYLPFNAGDKIEFINGSTLLTEGSAEVVSAELTDEQHITLKVKDSTGCRRGLFVENITLCPDLYFAGNRMSRIVTRGLLVTTRGKVLIEDNDFENLIMPAVLCSDDARSWFESGRCEDVTIRNNRFGKNDEFYIQVLPENRPRKNAVHGRFVIEGNVFEGNNGIDIQRSRELIFRNNTVPVPVKDFVHCTDVTKEEIS